MIKFFSLSKINFAKQNQISGGHSFEIGACGKSKQKAIV